MYRRGIECTLACGVYGATFRYPAKQHKWLISYARGQVTFCSRQQYKVRINVFGEVKFQVVRCSIYYNFLIFSPPPPILFISLLLLLLPFSVFLCFSFPLLINYVCHLQLTECCTAALSALNCCSLSLPHFTLRLSISPLHAPSLSHS